MHVVESEAGAVFGLEGRLTEEIVPGLGGRGVRPGSVAGGVAAFDFGAAPIVGGEMFDGGGEPGSGASGIDGVAGAEHFQESLRGDLLGDFATAGAADGVAEDIGGMEVIEGIELLTG